MVRPPVAIPPNRTIGQLRKTIPLLEAAEWAQLSDEERDAADALTLHVWWRCRQRLRPAFEGKDCVFLTVKHVQRLLRAVGARKTGEKAAATALRTMQARGWIEDTGKTKKPGRPEQSRERADAFAPATAELEGGKDAQPTLRRSCWWRVFRVPAISRVVGAYKPLGAYGTLQAVPQRLASLSALLRRQGLISKPKRSSRPNRGSVQWVFLHSGPP